MLKTKLVTINDEPTALKFEAHFNKPVSMVVQNLSDEEYVYVGDENVSTANFGVRIPPEGTFDVDLQNDDLYAATDGSSVTISVMSFDI